MSLPLKAEYLKTPCSIFPCSFKKLLQSKDTIGKLFSDKRNYLDEYGNVLT